MNNLKVWDIVYWEQYWNIQKYKIDRVTKNYAFSWTLKLEIAHVNGFCSVVNSTWNTQTYRLENEELKDNFHKKWIISRISGCVWWKLDISKLEQIYSIINS